MIALTSLIRRRQTIRLYLLALCLALVACSGGGDPQEEAAPEEQAQPAASVLTCSETCAANGQCGQTQDGRVRVLGHSGQPETRNHDRAFPVDVPVIVESQIQKIVKPVNGDPFPQTFSRVIIRDESSQVGWVADWCINPAAGQ